MSLLSTRRILYVLKTRSRYAVAQATGMAWKTVDRISKGLTEAPVKYGGAVRNLYQTTSYGNLRGAGMSASQSRRFTWYTPEKGTEVLKVINDKVDFLSKGWMGSHAQKTGLTFEELDRPEIWEMAREQIREGLRHSIKAYEEWELYGR